MLRPNNRILTRQQGMRIKVKNDPVFSPDIQGLSAWDKLTADQRGHLNHALTDACKHYKCRRRDLQWKIDGGGTIHVRKVPRIEL